MNFKILRYLILIFVLTSFSSCSFIESFSCDVNRSDFQLAQLIVDVGLDETNKRLKFFMNTMVLDLNNTSSSRVVIDDVNIETNKYTTFHVEIEFMGKTFINENKRFCDIIAVKNVSNSYGSPRYKAMHNRDNTVTTTPSVVAKRGLEFDDVDNISTDIGNSNSTIEKIFSNSTGDLIQCPLYFNDSIEIYYEADVTNHFHKLGSYTVWFSVISNSNLSEVIRCDKLYVTPVQSKYISESLLIGVLVLILVTAGVNFLTMIYSSYQESSNSLLFIASTICNEKLLKQLDATVSRIIAYLQFAFFMAGLDLQYPGFYQPLILQIRWCALLGITLIKEVPDRISMDNVYTTFRSTGLKNLGLYCTQGNELDIWQNFILCLIIWISIHVFAVRGFYVIKHIFDRIVSRYKGSPHHNSLFHEIHYKHFYGMVGDILSNFLQIFSVPFLILTFFMLYTANQLNGRMKRPYNAILYNAFSTNVPYQALLSPFRKINDKSSNSTDAYVSSGNFTSIGNFTFQESPDKNSSDVTIPLSCIILGAVLLAIWIALILYFSFEYIVTIKSYRLRKNSNISKLYTSMQSILLWAFLYHHLNPQKVYYVIVDIGFTFLHSIVIGCLQGHGLVQVVLCVIIEVCKLVALLLIKPYYLKMQWTSTRVILPIARLLITILCIPYMRELSLSEATRTYVAYAQLAIHLVVAIFFIVQLGYGIAITILSIFNSFENGKNENISPKSENNTITNMDNPGGEFDYYPISKSVQMFNRHEMENEYSFEKSSIIEDIDEDDIYYRSKSEKLLQKKYPGLSSATLTNFSCKSNVHCIDNYNMDKSMPDHSSLDQNSFKQQEYFSNLRKTENDYTTREGDLIYKRFFYDDEIDPEVKELWESRTQRMITSVPSKGNSSQDHCSIRNNFLSFFKLGSKFQNSTEEKGFHVSRPKELIVRTLSQISNQEKSNQEKS